MGRNGNRSDYKSDDRNFKRGEDDRGEDDSDYTRDDYKRDDYKRDDRSNDCLAQRKKESPMELLPLPGRCILFGVGPV